MKRYLIIAYILLSTSYANSGIISGFISDSSSGEALIGANVFLKETGQGMATDLNGYYIIQNISPGSYTIMTSYVGFERFEKIIILKEEESVKLDISLIELVVELSGISVTAEKLQRKNLDGIVLNSMQDKGAGFSVSTNKITFIHSDKSIHNFPLQSKWACAETIFDQILTYDS